MISGCEHQQVDVVLQRDRMLSKPLAANRCFIQLLLLDHRPHRAVEDQDAGEELFERSAEVTALH